MKKFIVVSQVYDRGPSPGISVELYENETLEACLRDVLGLDKDDEIDMEDLEYYNGDGSDYIIINELTDDGLVLVFGEKA